MPRTLVGCWIEFHTRDDDKDWDTNVTLTVRDGNNMVCAYISKRWPCFPDHTWSGRRYLQVLYQQTPELLRTGTITFHVDTVGDDTWRFDFDIFLQFSPDGLVMHGGETEMELSDESTSFVTPLEHIINFDTVGSTSQPLSPVNSIEMPYSGIFAKKDEDFVSCWGYARGDFDGFVRQHARKGYSPVMFREHVVPNFLDGGWAVILRKNRTAVPTRWLYGYPRADFDHVVSELYASRYRAATITAHQGVDGTSWSGVFIKDGHQAPCVWGYARADFDRKNAEYERQGLALSWVQAVTGTDGNPSWIGIWRDDARDQSYVYGWARPDFDKHASEMGRKGYHPVLVNGYWGPDGGVGWNGIWEKSGAQASAVWGWARHDFDQEAQKKRAAGMKLISLDC